MKYLLDTAVWLRGYFQPDTIPERQRRILADASETFGLSAISLWEVGKKHQLGKLPLDRDLEAWFHHAIAGNVDVLPLTQKSSPRQCASRQFRPATPPMSSSWRPPGCIGWSWSPLIGACEVTGTRR